MSTFTAKYRSRCADCDGAIEPGDEITYAGERVVHANGECEVESAASRPAPAAGRVCPKCFTEKSVSGACACDAW